MKMSLRLSFGRLGSVLRINNSGGFLDSVGVAAGFGFGRLSSGSVRTFWSSGFGRFRLGWVRTSSSSSVLSSESNEEELSSESDNDLASPRPKPVTLPLGHRVSMNMSIESIKLKIYDKTKAPRHIYGEIKVPFPLTYIFRRHRNQAQLVPDDDGDGDGFPLILCGPNHIIWSDEGITVELYESPSRPFITAGEEYDFEFGKIHIPTQEHIYTPDRSARLTLTYTGISPSYPAIFQFRVIQPEPVVLVSGTIRGIQRVPEGTTTNWITIFDSRGEAVAVPKGDPIPLDRFYFIVPVQTGNQGEECFRGASFNIDVDLQLHTNSFKLFSIKGQANVVFTRHDKMGQPKFFTVGRPSHGPVIQISVTNFHEYLPQGDIEQTLEH